MSLPSKVSDGAGQEDPLIGKIVSDRYRIDSLLGEGAMGRVYKAEHVLIRKRLALKVLHRELAASPELLARSEREAMAAANIEHANVASATDFGKLPDGSVFLALEFVEGKSLQAEMNLGAMVPERALRIARQIASALEAAHALKIIHRDIKPDNVMLVDKRGERDFVKVLDFGVAKVPVGEMEMAEGQPVTQVGAVFGTPEYMAPEQALGATIDHRADLYALGIVLFEMIAGQHPFDAQSSVGVLSQQLSKPAPPVSQRAPGVAVPQAVDELLQKLLAKDADGRFQDAASVVKAIDAILVQPHEREHLRTWPDGTAQGAVNSPLGAPETVPVPHAPSGVAPPPSSQPAASQSPLPLPGTLMGMGPDGAEPRIIDPNGPPATLRTGEEPPRPLIDTSFLPKQPTEALWSVYRRIDDWKSNLPGQIREVPTPALLGASAFLGIIVLIGLIGVMRAIFAGDDDEIAVQTSPSATAATATPEAPESPPDVTPVSSIDTDLESAGGDVKKLEALLEANSKEPKLYAALARAHLAAKAYGDALDLVERALDTDAELANVKEFANVFWVAVQSEPTRDRAFRLLQGPMKSKGADIVYDLATNEQLPRDVRRRAEKWLHSKGFDENSSARLHALVSLRYAETCRQRHALLLRVKAQGDHRVLAHLKELSKEKGCGPGGERDCNPCLRDDELLNDTIRAVEERVKQNRKK